MRLAKDKGSVLATAGLVLFASLLAVTGCKKSEEAAPSGSSQAASTATGGQAVYVAQGCPRCHVINGQGGRMGPDLSRVGAEPGHTAEWIIEHVKNPQSHNPGSRMPAFAGKISDSDLKALGDYLASLK